MAKILKSKLFLAVAAITATAVFLIGMNASRVYKSEARVMFVFKSAAAAENAKRIMQDAEEIFASLKFYDELIADSFQFGDLAGDLSNSEKEKIWDARSGFQKVKGSNLAKIMIRSANRQEAEDISREAARKIAAVMSRYYNIKTDLDMRIIDGATFQKSDAVIKWIIIGIFSGLFFGLAAYFMHSGWRRNTEKIGRQFEGRIKEIFTAARQAGTGEKEIEIEENIQTEEIPDFSEKENFVAGLNKKASAPENLPVGDDFVLEVKKTPEKKEAGGEEAIKREATPEEVKERLNKLLRGEM